MNREPLPSKLFIRSEVLAVIQFLTTVEDPPKQDKLKQIKRLAGISDIDSVQRILVKELQRATHTRTIQAVTELLMDLGTIAVVQEPLWRVIETPGSSDEVRDAANLILRQLGDQSDPNLYLDYLEDPAGLINRETERMLEVATRNPEALIDFIDFIFSLPVGEQCNLLSSLQSDYPPQYLLGIYLAMLEADPPYETQTLLLGLLGEIRDRRAALFLYQHRQHYTQDARLGKALKQSISALRIAGIYKEEALAIPEMPTPHPMVTHSTLYQCFATISDGIGNEGIVISRRKDNGDVVMMSVALNDCHGVIDCFGFYELSTADFQKIAEKFHEESSKIAVPAAFCLARLQTGEALNRAQRFRIPYEYTCWKVILDDVSLAEAPDTIALCREWAQAEWEAASDNLYQHPDFSTWFLEEGDHPAVTEALLSATELCRQALAREIRDQPAKTEDLPETLLKALSDMGDHLVHGLLATEWRTALIRRLADAAYLLQQQGTQTFSRLAATETVKLLAYQGLETPLVGFIHQYGRRCIEEHLLRLRHEKAFPQQERFSTWVDTVLTTWNPD